MGGQSRFQSTKDSGNNIFTKRPKLEGTPPHGRRNSTGSFLYETTVKDDENPDAVLKRKRETTPAKPNKRKESTDVKHLSEAIKNITTLARDISNNIENNTKREIKDLSMRLTRQVKSLNDPKIIEWIEKHKYEENPISTTEQSTQTEDEIGKLPRPQQNRTTQTSFTPVNLEQPDKQQIQMAIQTLDNIEEIHNTLGLNWTEDNYQKSKLKASNILQEPENDNMVMIVDINNYQQSKLLSEVSKQNTQAAQVINEDSFKSCKLAVLVRSDTLLNEEGTCEETKCKTLFLTGIDDTAEALRTTMSLMTSIEKTKNVAQARGIKS